MRTNPAWGAALPTQRAGVQYRYNATAAITGFHTARASGSYPLISTPGLPIVAVSGAFMQDGERPSGIFERQEISGGLSVGVPVSRSLLLAAGFQANYHQEDVILNNLTTGSQYLPERGYNPDIGNGEEFGDLQHRYLSYAAGLTMNWVDQSSLTPRHYFALALYDFNEPPLSFLDDASRRPSTWVAQGAATVFQKEAFRIRPDFLFQTNGDLTSTTFGVGWGYNLGDLTNPAELWVNTRYRWREAGIVGASIRKDAFTLGYTYDFAVASSGTGLHHTGAHELAIRYELPKGDGWWWYRFSTPEEEDEGTREPRRLNFNWPSINIKWPNLNIRWPQLNVRWPRWMKIKRRRPRYRKPRRGRGGTVPVRRPRPEATPDSVGTDPETPQGEVEIGLIEQELELPEPDTVVLENIVKHFHFPSNEAELDTLATQYLDSLVESLVDNPDWLIDISGHTDDVGDEELNRSLSRERALSVGWYLAQQGISRRRIRIRGFGEQQPLDDNSTREGRANNRRVEITIYRVPPKD